MNDTLLMLDEMKVNSLSFISDFVDWIVNSPTPFIFVGLFISLYIVKVVKRMIL